MKEGREGGPVAVLRLLLAAEVDDLRIMRVRCLRSPCDESIRKPNSVRFRATAI